MLPSPKKLFGRGLALAIPLAVVVYVLLKILEVFEKLIKPIAEKLGIDKILGQLTLTILALLLMVVIIFLLGILMQVRFVSTIGRSIDEFVTKLIPSLGQFKAMTAEKLDLENEAGAWKPVMVLHEAKYFPGFVVEEVSDKITLFLVKGNNIQEGEILITSKSEISLVAIDAHDIHQFSRQYGKGYLALITEKGQSLSKLS
ncbi:MAG: hypothetical protein ACHQET_06720 [Chitinophagales bacterium]